MNSNTSVFCADDDSALLLEGVATFAGVEIRARQPRPEIAISHEQLQAITHAARQTGLLGMQEEGLGLWSELACHPGSSPAFSLAALQKLAQANTAAAWHLHSLALADAVKTRLGEATANNVFSDVTLNPGGALGWGRSALIRWLGQCATEDDIALLADNYGERQRLVWVSNCHTALLLPVFDGSEFWWVLQKNNAHAASQNKRAHGVDGLDLVQVTASLPAAGGQKWRVPRDLWQDVMVAQLLATVAIAAGAVARAADLARRYADIRHQGGHRIISHDAVALLLAELHNAETCVQTMLTGLGKQPSVTLADALSSKLTALELLSNAANAAVQVHGGSGYMRDTGVESILRDLNCLRVMAGSPDELALMLATTRSPMTAQREHDIADNTIAGFVAPESAMAPLQAFKSITFLRWMAGYTPAETSPDTHLSLPPALVRYREQLRAFAERELRPHALPLDRALAEPHSTPLGSRPAVLDELIAKAGRAGLLSDLLPKPMGSVPPTRYRFSLPWLQAIRTEMLARVDGGLMLALSAHNLGLVPILLSGDLGVLQSVVLPAFRACEQGDPQLFAFAITEPAAGSDAEDGYGALRNRPGVVAHPAPGGWNLRGRKVFISGGDHARWIVVFAALAGEGFDSWTAFLVDAKTHGFSRERNELKMGMRASGATELAFDNCFVPDSRVLGGVRKGWALNRATLNFSRLPVAGMSLGFAQSALEIATDFVCRTHWGGRPLLHDQQVQLRLADMQAITTSLQAMVWHFARAWTPRQAHASMAKFYVTDQAQRVIETAMHLCGEWSLLHEQGLEKIFRDNRLTRIFEGTNQINRLAVIEDQQPALIKKIHSTLS